MEISSSASRSDADWNHELVSEIERLTEETRYYD